MSSDFSYQKTSLGGYDAQIEKYEGKQKALQTKNSKLPTASIWRKSIKHLSGASEGLENDPKKGELTILSRIKKWGNDLQIKRFDKKIDSLKNLKIEAEQGSELKYINLKLENTTPGLLSAIQRLKEDIRSAPTPENKKALQAQLKGLQLAVKNGPIQHLKEKIEGFKKEIGTFEGVLKGFQDEKKEAVKNFPQNPYLRDRFNSKIEDTKVKIKKKQDNIKECESEIKKYKNFSDSPTEKAFNDIVARFQDPQKINK